MFRATRIQHLAEVAPEKVTKLGEGSYVVEVTGNQKVNDVMKGIRADTKEWADDNGLHPDGKAPRPYLGMLRQPNDSFWAHELGWGE